MPSERPIVKATVGRAKKKHQGSKKNERPGVLVEDQSSRRDPRQKSRGSEKKKEGCSEREAKRSVEARESSGFVHQLDKDWHFGDRGYG